MHSLLDSTSVDTHGGSTEFSTRVVLLQNIDAAVVLPYVVAVLDAIGQGSAHCVEGVGAHGGILLTTPVGISHFIDSTIKTSLDTASLKQFGHTIFYAPAIMLEVKDSSIEKTVDVQKAIGSLGLIPPDMKCEWAQISSDRAAILVSGPRSREATFKSDILKSLMQLVSSLDLSGSPLN